MSMSTEAVEKAKAAMKVLHEELQTLESLGINCSFIAKKKETAAGGKEIEATWNYNELSSLTLGRFRQNRRL